jgi:DNA-binding CsgD family transcriptional regulator/PAS domain-containing protein
MVCVCRIEGHRAHMQASDALVRTIEAIHAAALDPELWPRALSAATQLCGGVAATLEVFDKPTGGHVEFHSHGVPPLHELTYVDQYLPINPRVAFGLRQRVGEVGWDYQILDEAELARDPFYSDFLPRIGFRYFVSGVLRQTAQEFAAVAVQRSAAQGHASTADIGAMRQLVPHFSQALDVATRLKRGSGAIRSLESALDWLADGVALLAADGSVIYANDALQAIVRRGAGLRIAKGVFEFSASEARTRFAAAIAAVISRRAGHPHHEAVADFAIARGAKVPPYLVSIRPLPGKEGSVMEARAVAIVFVRDPLDRTPAPTVVLRDVFGFTEAEARLARALQAGSSLAAYARESRLSLNTVYTHLRRTKEKAGCKRLGELVHKLNELQVPLLFG